MDELEHVASGGSDASNPSMSQPFMNGNGGAASDTAGGAAVLLPTMPPAGDPSHQPGALAVDGSGIRDPQDLLFASAVASAPHVHAQAGGDHRAGASSAGVDAVLAGLASGAGNAHGAAASAIVSRAKVFHGKGSFPLNLAVMLESVGAMNLGHIISWLPSGQSFVIHSPDRFLEVVLPKFFKASKNTKLRSFYRKLNRWGFSILRNHHLTKQGVGSMKGVWHHPEFFRSRALECLKIALETGDTSSFLTVPANKLEDEKLGEVDFQGEAPCMSGRGGLAAGKKRRVTSPTPSLRDSSTTESTDLRLSFLSNSSGQAQQWGQNEGDFSLGSDAQNFDAFRLSQFSSQANSFLNQPAASSTNGGPFNLGNNFTGTGTVGSTTGATGNNGFNLANSFAEGTNLTDMQALTNNFMSQEGRRTSDFSMGSHTNFPHNHHNAKPHSSGSGGGRHNAVNSRGNGRRGRTNRQRMQGVSASWTAGSTFSQHDFNFPPAPFPFQTLEGQGQNRMMGNNDNVDRMKELAAMRHQEPNPPRQQQMDQQGVMEKPPDDERDLASFFEKFAESLQK